MDFDMGSSSTLKAAQANAQSDARDFAALDAKRGERGLRGCTSHCDAPKGVHHCGDYPAPETLQAAHAATYGVESLLPNTAAQKPYVGTPPLGSPWISQTPKAVEPNEALKKLMDASRFTPIVEPKEDTTNPKDRMGAAKIPTLSVVPASSLLALGNVMRLGAEKYGRFNWREKAVRTSVYADAAMRHLMSFMDGEDVDPESGETHLAHVMACMCIVIDARARGVLKDDRSNPGADMGYQLTGTAAEIIKASTRIVH